MSGRDYVLIIWRTTPNSERTIVKSLRIPLIWIALVIILLSAFHLDARPLFKPMHEAANMRDYERLRTLVSKANGKTKIMDKKGGPQALTAILRTHGHCEAAQLLIDNGVSIDTIDDGGTQLHNAAASDCTTVVELLAERIDVNSKAASLADTPLHKAVTGVQCKSAEILLSHGADISARNELGQTPLHAVMNRYCMFPYIQLFINHGADVNAEDNFGNTPIELLAKVQTSEYGIKWRDNASRLLADNGADYSSYVRLLATKQLLNEDGPIKDKNRVRAITRIEELLKGAPKCVAVLFTDGNGGFDIIKNCQGVSSEMRVLHERLVTKLHENVPRDLITQEIIVNQYGFCYIRTQTDSYTGRSFGCQGL